VTPRALPRGQPAERPAVSSHARCPTTSRSTTSTTHCRPS
jgi:hypothetical protein